MGGLQGKGARVSPGVYGERGWAGEQLCATWDQIRDLECTALSILELCPAQPGYTETLRAPALLVLPRLPAELLLECLELSFLCLQQLILALGLFLCQLEPIPRVLGDRMQGEGES